MKLMLVPLLYIYFFFPYKKLLLNIIVYSIIKLELYLYIVIVFILYLYLINFFTKKLKKFLLKLKQNIYIKSNFDLIRSYNYVFIFSIYYFIYLKLLVVIANRQMNFNVFFAKKMLIEYASHYQYTRCVVLFIFLFLMLLYCIFFLQNYIIFFFYKKHYLKLHYYSFIRNKVFRAFMAYIIKIELILKKKLKHNYIIYVYIRQYLPKIFVIFYFFVNIFINDGEIGNVIKIMPYYSFYFFILNMYNYIIVNFNQDFDILVAEFYYPKLNFLIEKNDLKKKEYIKNLLFNNSKFLFKDSIYYEFQEKIEPNFLLIQTYKYSLNKPPNDFYSRIQKLKPEKMI